MNISVLVLMGDEFFFFFLMMGFRLCGCHTQHMQFYVPFLCHQQEDRRTSTVLFLMNLSTDGVILS